MTFDSKLDEMRNVLDETETKSAGPRATIEAGWADGGLVPSVRHASDLDPVDSYDAIRQAQQTAIVRVLHTLVDDSKNPEAVGRRAATLAFLFGMSPCKNQTELARFLKCSKGHVSSLVNAVSLEYGLITTTSGEPGDL